MQAPVEPVAGSLQTHFHGRLPPSIDEAKFGRGKSGRMQKQQIAIACGQRGQRVHAVQKIAVTAFGIAQGKPFGDLRDIEAASLMAVMLSEHVVMEITDTGEQIPPYHDLTAGTFAKPSPEDFQRGLQKIVRIIPCAPGQRTGITSCCWNEGYDEVRFLLIGIASCGCRNRFLFCDLRYVCGFESGDGCCSAHRSICYVYGVVKKVT